MKNSEIEKIKKLLDEKSLSIYEAFENEILSFMLTCDSCSLFLNPNDSKSLGNIKAYEAGFAFMKNKIHYFFELTIWASSTFKATRLSGSIRNDRYDSILDQIEEKTGSREHSVEYFSNLRIINFDNIHNAKDLSIILSVLLGECV
ncbi:gp490 [Bacillus phage G]|uniref:Gp490 n=1 Tax=Bacillus phage G TaxID=2884420 RepID=G3MAN1_9CAUD|nr:gp490 [Bacillus phage G]AEO93748.1 gp490 [Bacillus phage G]